MIKLTFCLRRLPHLSHEEFLRTWRENHAPLVREHAPALGLRRYVQTHADHGALTEGLGKPRGAPEPYDGVAELWFESRQALVEAGRTDAGRAAGRALYEDEKRFIDFSRSPIFIGEEVEVVA